MNLCDDSGSRIFKNNFFCVALTSNIGVVVESWQTYVLSQCSCFKGHLKMEVQLLWELNNYSELMINLLKINKGNCYGRVSFGADV